MPDDPLSGRRVLISVGGSVAAFKAALVTTALRERGAEVRVAMTEGAQHFITPLTLQSLSGHPVATSLWDGVTAAAADDHGMAHISLSRWAEVHAVVAASASLLARLAIGLADDPVTATALASEAPLVIAAAMESAMWRHAATRANVTTLTERGARFVGPVSGRLASGRTDEGRMADPMEIVAAIADALGN